MEKVSARSLKDSAITSPGLGPQIRRIGVSEEVISRFKNLIAQQVLPAGSRLPAERDLAKSFGVSRPTLRQAMKALEILRVIRRRQGDGSYLTESASEILREPLEFAFALKRIARKDLFETRKALEVRLASLAATRRTDKDLEDMRNVLSVMKASMGSPEQWCLHEMHFHECIVHAACNTVMTTIMEMLSHLLIESRRETVRLLTSYDESYRSHEVVFIEIKKQNPLGAAKAMEKHFAIMEARARTIGLSADIVLQPRNEAKRKLR